MNEIMVSELVDTYLESKKRKPSEYKGTLYSSELGMCARRIYYSYKIPKGVSIDALRVFEVGNLVHGHVSEILQNKANVEAITKWKDEKNIAGSEAEKAFPILVVDKSGKQVVRIAAILDELITFKDGDRLILENKTIGDFRYLTDAKEEHVMQANLYMYATGVQKAKIVYYHKNEFAVKEFSIEKDYALLERVMDRALMLDKCITTNTVPIAEPKAANKTKKTPWQCSMVTKDGKKIECPYFNECNQQDEEDAKNGKIKNGTESLRNEGSQENMAQP